MTEMAEYESLLAGRFAALSTSDHGDWADVRRRSRRARLRRAALGLAAMVVAVVVAAPALGLHRAVIDWFRAESASERTQLEFLRLDVIAPEGMAPGVVPNAARKVMMASTSRATYTLSVAPTKAGGFCWQWSDYVGSCTPNRSEAYTDREKGNVNTFALGATMETEADGSVRVVSGRLLGDEIERLALEYEDGKSIEIPFTWVSPPIDAGFYLYEVPEEHRLWGHRATALLATDGDGQEIARQTFRLPLPGDVERTVRLPDGITGQLPVRALVDQARKVIEITLHNGERHSLWVMPTRDGGQCYVYNRGGACSRPGGPEPPALGAGLHGGATVVVAGRVRRDVALYELRYQDGAIERLRPVEGFILHEITPEHYPRGQRLDRIRALGSRGRALAQQEVSTGPGTYPCEQPVDIGRGLMACP